MAEEVEYSLVPAEGEPLKTSRGFSGKAIATYTNGDTYNGMFVDGCRCGEGVYTFTAMSTDIEEEEKKARYEGSWAENTKCGIGKQVYPGVGVYHGYWKGGQRDGEGVMQYNNKDVYSGSWVCGKKEGRGTFIFFETKQKFVGDWRKGTMVTGKWAYPNGTSFVGSFDNNKPKGKGEWSFANGNKVEGCYKQTMRVDVDDYKLSWKTTGDITA